ncbi:MAG: DUF192 domain-containing protein [Actinomycetota bacterium]
MASPPPGDPARPRSTLSRRAATLLAVVLAAAVACSGGDDVGAPATGEEDTGPPSTSVASSDSPDATAAAEPEDPSAPDDSVASDAATSSETRRTLVIDEPASVDAEPAIVETGESGSTAKDVARAVSADELPDGFVPGVEPIGFDVIGARFTSAAGDVCEVCLWLAAESDDRSQGLRRVTDLGEPGGMLFTWDEPSTSNFVMFETPMPLSIAWFAADGAFVAATDMEPCIQATSAGCTRYRPDAEYRFAVEVVQGELGALRIGPGSSIELLDPDAVPGCIGG